MCRGRAELAHKSNEEKQQGQTSYMEMSAEVMTPPALHTIKETSSQLFDFSTMVFRYQEKHNCTLTSVEKIQINMLMKGKQPTAQPS